MASVSSLGVTAERSATRDANVAPSSWMKSPPPLALTRKRASSIPVKFARPVPAKGAVIANGGPLETAAGSGSVPVTLGLAS